MTARILTLAVLLAASHREAPANEPPAITPMGGRASAELRESGGQLGVSVSASAWHNKPIKGNEYELRYQIRVHTKAGECGPILGVKAHPAGASFTLCRVKCERDSLELRESFDLTRKDVQALIGLPFAPAGKYSHEVFLRVESQLFDATANKYLTPVRTPAVILVAEVGEAGQVYRLQSLALWTTDRASVIYDAKKELARLGDLDEYLTVHNQIEWAIDRVLREPGVTNDMKALYIDLVNPGSLLLKDCHYLRKQLEEFASGSDATLKKAAQKKLDEAK